MTLAPHRLELTTTHEHADGRETLLEDRMGPVVYEGDVDALAGDFLSEYETIQMSIDLTPVERTEYDGGYQTYQDYVNSHDFSLWKGQGYAGFLKWTSYDPQGRRTLIAKQRAECIARTTPKKLDTFDNLFEHHRDDYVIIFTANNDFTYDISRGFILPCTTRQADTDERAEIFDQFRSGEYSMLATSQVLNEDVDVSAANTGIIPSGNASRRQYAQRLGRILRPIDDRQPIRLYKIITIDVMGTYVSQR